MRRSWARGAVGAGSDGKVREGLLRKGNHQLERREPQPEGTVGAEAEVGRLDAQPGQCGW